MVFGQECLHLRSCMKLVRRLALKLSIGSQSDIFFVVYCITNFTRVQRLHGVNDSCCLFCLMRSLDMGCRSDKLLTRRLLLKITELEKEKLHGERQFQMNPRQNTPVVIFGNLLSFSVPLFQLVDEISIS